MNLEVSLHRTRPASERCPLKFLKSFAFVGALLIASASTVNAQGGPPNVVLIFADDLGFGDLGCYGAKKVQTPNIDRLAKEGRKFTDAHSASAVCTPSRYGLLTGEYPVRKNIWGPCSHNQPLLIDTNKLTLGKLFKDKGYATAAIGKWHLGFGLEKTDWNKPLRPGPLELGFDYYFGVPKVNSGFPYVYVENDRIVGWDPADPLVFGKPPYSKTPTFPHAAGNKTANRFSGAKVAHEIYHDERTASLLVEKSVNWIKENREHPFFLYLPTTNIHHPFTPAPQFKGTSECGLYGDFIHELDWMVGEVLKSLDENGLAENTLVIFTSDNGGMFNTGGQNAFKDGHRQNGDLLGFKFGIWEGGHRIPFIARWPGEIQPDTTSPQLICSVDMLATFAALTEQSVQKSQLADSVNVLPALLDEPTSPLRDHVVLSPFKATHLSIRKGKWMYIDAKNSGGFGNPKPGAHTFSGAAAAAFVGNVNSDITPEGKIRHDAPPGQLYDLDADALQTTNLYRQHPEVVAELKKLLKTYAPARKSNPRRKREKSQPKAMQNEAGQFDSAASTSPAAAAEAADLKPAASSVRLTNEERTPNFVVIFADDLGYGDLSCYGPTGVQTPHLDALAAEGFRSTDFFVPANVCSPSRAALLTGRYPMRCGLPVARNEGHPKYKNYGLASEEITIPEVLKPAGYRSLMAGKWHLGIEIKGSHPIDAGFDEHLGIPSNYSKGRGPNYNTLYRGKEVEEKNVPCQALTKRYTDEVVAFIERQKDDPFFIYVSHHIVHTPLLPSKDFVGTSRKGKYGDFIKELDHSTGRIMKAIRDAGIDDNTVVVFTSDNGPTGPGSAGGLNGGKYCTMEGGHRVPGIFRWPGRIPAGQVSSTTLTSMDLFPLFCDLAGVQPPVNRKLDGENVLPILQGKAVVTPHEFLYYYNGTNLQAVRERNWKLHLPRTGADQPFWSKPKKPDKKKGFLTLDEPALFNLRNDPGERRNVAGNHPDVVARLRKQADAIRTELGDVRVTGSDQREINLIDPQER